MDPTSRMKQAFAVLTDTSFGTLWWAGNELWKQSKSFVLKPEQEGKRHPGVSLRKNSSSDCSIVPLLLGSSQKSSGRSTVKLKMSERSDKTSYFGALKPVNMSYLNFLDGSIRSNRNKPRLTEDEKKRLNAFLERRLSWFTK